MMLLFDEKGWDDYLYWQETDKKKLRCINELIKECIRAPFTGRGKPEPLKGDLRGYWSRRIDEEHRLVYCFQDNKLTIIVCRYLY